MMFDIEVKEFTLDSNLSQDILNFSFTKESRNITNVGGWQRDIISNGGPAPDWLKPTVNQILDHFPEHKISRLWVNINGCGHYNKWHRHNLSKVVVLYVSVPENSGAIEFRENNEIYKLTPKTGQLVTFPGTLEHRVLENQSNENRISIAINLW